MVVEMADSMVMLLAGLLESSMVQIKVDSMVDWMAQKLVGDLVVMLDLC